ncbi:SET domain-containing protein [Tahibacter amnicola]|uniref:SET domain-containing protein n=1 Tax=Tahibacter amnicola TaxID=2976241 RepID=A0ABY6BBH2_9GAMM|nr:SET domain-containing protein [Tahibacter amnicola]UXI67157.1 SET domain-containing protein [Tahibacter amnicola]
MILPKYHVAPSRIAGAGKGLFLDEPVVRGRLITAPDAIAQVYRFDEISRMPNAAELLPATVRWFEDRYTVSPEWPDECYINHAFEPTGLWHLGFVFAARDLDTGTEITVDYRHLLAPGQHEDFHDASTGHPIIGFSWEESLRQSTEQLRGLIA